MIWTEDAEKYIERIPPFIRKAVKKTVETYAAKKGLATVDSDFLEEAKHVFMGNHSKGSKADGQENSERSSNGESTGVNLQTSLLTEKIERRFFAREDADPLPHAFEKKAAVHAGLGGKPVREEDLPAHWTEIRTQERQDKTCAYFHIPFCKGHCLYCGFYMNRMKPENSYIYTDALIMELVTERSSPLACSGPVHAVYLGGGTPTALNADDLHRLLEAIRLNLPLANDCEITVEARVKDFDEDKMDACIEGGANRFSIGVQSFSTEIRQRLGRIANRETVLQFLKTLHDKDQAAVIIDLIYGLPGQRLDDWENDIRTYLDTGIDGVDLYQLNTFNGGPLDEAVKKGKVPAPAPLPEQSGYFVRGLELMEGARCRRLSICHWARTTRERNLYNSLTKSGKPCLAYGSGAGGKMGNYSFFMEGDLQKYLYKVRAHEKPVAMIMARPERYAFVGDVAGGMEQGKLDLHDLGIRHGMDCEKLYEPLIRQWAKVGLLKIDGAWITLTPAGQFWCVNLSQAMIDYFNLMEKKEKILATSH